RRGRRRAQRLGGGVRRALRAFRRLPSGGAGRDVARACRRDRRRARRRLCLAAVADELKPAYLLAGSDRPKVDRALDRLRPRFDPDAVEFLSADEATGDDAVAACNALGLFAGDGRLVVVDNAEAWKAPDVKAVAVYLKSPAPATTLALVAGELKKDAPIVKAVAAAGDVLLWDVPKRGPQRWVG